MCSHGALCSIPFNLICNMTTFRKDVDLLTRPGGGGSEDVCKDSICT